MGAKTQVGGWGGVRRDCWRDATAWTSQWQDIEKDGLGVHLYPRAHPAAAQQAFRNVSQHIPPLGLNPSTASCLPEPLKSQPSGPPTSLLGLSPPSLHWSRASFPGPSSSFLPQGLCTSVPSAWRALPGPSPGCYFFLSSPLFGEASLSSTTPTIRATLLSSSKQLSPLEVFLAVYFLHPSPNQNRS